MLLAAGAGHAGWLRRSARLPSRSARRAGAGILIAFSCHPHFNQPQEELDLKGIKHIGGPADGDKKVELKPGMLLEQDPDVSGKLGN